MDHLHLQPSHQDQAMDRSRQERFYVLAGLFVVFLLQWAYYLAPEGEALPGMFKYSDQLISKQSYYHFIWLNVAFMICIHLVWLSLKQMRLSVGVFFILWFGYLIDYYLCYNEPFAHFGRLPISYSHIAGLCMLVTVLIDTLRS
jgi:hypothetical protein